MHALRTIQAAAVLVASYAVVAVLGAVAMIVVGIAAIASLPFRQRTA